MKFEVEMQELSSAAECTLIEFKTRNNYLRRTPSLRSLMDEAVYCCQRKVKMRTVRGLDRSTA